MTDEENFPHNGGMAETSSLLRKTISLLDGAKGAGISLKEIADASEGTVLFEWLKKFDLGKIADPSVNRTEALHNCLVKLRSKRKLS